MDYLTIPAEVFLSIATIMFTGFHAYLVMSQRLSYFHSVKYLLFFSYLSFGTVVAAELVLSQVTNIALATLMMKTSISAVIVAAILLATASQVLRLQARGHETPYKELRIRKSTSLLITIGANLSILALVWNAFQFNFVQGTIPLLGTPTLIASQSLSQLALLSVVYLGFLWHQSKLLSEEIVTQSKSLSNVIKTTGLLWIVMSSILFTVSGALRILGIDIVVFGHLLESIVLGYLAYTYAKPTALLEFFASNSPLAIELKRKQFSKVLDLNMGFGKKILLEVDSISDYHELVYYYLGSGWKPGVCVTYEGSPLRLAGSMNKTVKMIGFSMSADRITVSKDETIEAPLFKKNTYDLLKWTIEANPQGRIVLDGISHLIQLLGIDEVYSIVSYVSELCAKNGVQLLLTLNYQVHKLEVISSFEGMADHVIQLERNRVKQIKPVSQVTITIPTGNQVRPE
ncbi:MAG: hypothetical protein HYY67_03835 [Thaumarchaeota archaeon]|nr:hypothetical protein [Nitrososphaerota archaeon]